MKRGKGMSFFGCRQFNFVFLGAGSSVFTMRLVGDILQEDFVEAGEIRLVDIDPIVLKEISTAVKKLVKYAGKPLVVKSFENFRDALPDADFVFLTYAVGGIASWKKDIDICTKYGVYQSVGDTIGPGAMIRILRSVPVALEIAHEMEKVCPNAYIINYTNPEGAQCLAIEKYSKVKTFGLCHGTPDTAKELAEKVFEVDQTRFTYEAAGVNHLTWFTSMRIDGKDVYPELREKLEKTGYASKEQISRDLYRVFGLYPAPGDRHVEEFFSAFLKKDVIEKRNLEWKNNDFVVVQKWRDEGQALIDAVLQRNEGYEEFMKGSGETATHFMRSLATGAVCMEMVNVQNKGYIENVTDGIIVEVPTFVNEFGLKPQHVGELPAAIAAKCEALGREYQLLVDAAITGDKNKVLQAAYLDPLCANCDYPEELINELIFENLDLLPNFWRGNYIGE